MRIQPPRRTSFPRDMRTPARAWLGSYARAPPSSALPITIAAHACTTTALCYMLLRWCRAQIQPAWQAVVWCGAHQLLSEPRSRIPSLLSDCSGDESVGCGKHRKVPQDPSPTRRVHIFGQHRNALRIPESRSITAPAAACSPLVAILVVRLFGRRGLCVHK